jgi:hypothetical protein
MLNNTATPERCSFQQRRGAEPSDLSSARSDRGKSKEPTSGLEPLTPAHYELGEVRSQLFLIAQKSVWIGRLRDFIPPP